MPSLRRLNSESTSRHKLSADNGLSKPQRVLWLIYNMLNNRFPRIGIDHKLQELKFRLTADRLDELWESIGEVASPSRSLCDLFWMSLPWEALSKELSRVAILEAGCGSGVYGRLLEEILGDYFQEYVGIDIVEDEQWNKVTDSSRFSFETSRASDAYRFMAGKNVIITQSALEHFEEDLLYFQQISDYVFSSEDPILQVHLIPSASCIVTFPWHGIREYTPRTISRITRLFDSRTQAYLIGLGGSTCNKVHRRFITWPYFMKGSDLRYVSNHAYRAALRSAILEDFDRAGNESAFYALVMMTNFSNDLPLQDLVQ